MKIAGIAEKINLNQVVDISVDVKKIILISFLMLKKRHYNIFQEDCC